MNDPFDPQTHLALRERIEELQAERDSWKERWKATTKEMDRQRDSIEKVRHLHKPVTRDTNHAHEAASLLASIKTPDWNAQGKYLDRLIAAGQVQATLALAEQQRIANLIALFDMGGPHALNGIEYADLTKQIVEALELGDPHEH